MAAMGPHSQQQSIHQSTNIRCNRSTSLKLEKNVFITNNMTINARCLDDDKATMIASLALLTPLCCCLPRRCLALIPHVVTPLAKLPCLRPLHHHVLEAVDCWVLSCVQHQSPITPISMLWFWCLSWLLIRQWIPATRHPLTRTGMGHSPKKPSNAWYVDDTIH